MSSPCNQNRIELLLKNPNPLFVKWMTEWSEHANQNNLKTKSVFQNCLVSLKKYPLPLKTGADCIILQGFGVTLCRILDKRLNEHKLEISKKPEPQKNQNPVVKNADSILITPNSKGEPKKDIVHKKVVVENPDSILMSPNSFDIILLIDTQETSAKQFLEKQKIKFEVRKLQVGDFAWIVRDHKNIELVIPYIVERKRLDDLASSIKDGRFHEQKFRLKQSGIQNLIYLIERHGSSQFTGLPFQTLMQAATNTQVHSKFQVKFTDDHDESMLYLTVLTELLTDIYKNKVIISSPKSDLKPSHIESDFISMMRFDEFNKLSTKSRKFTTRELFVKQLMQLKTLSVEKALAILKVYPTPKALMDAYKNCKTLYNNENLLANIKFGLEAKSIGPLISKKLYHLYNNKVSS